MIFVDRMIIFKTQVNKKGLKDALEGYINKVLMKSTNHIPQPLRNLESELHVPLGHSLTVLNCLKTKKKVNKTHKNKKNPTS